MKIQAPNGHSLRQTAVQVVVLFKILTAICLVAGVPASRHASAQSATTVNLAHLSLEAFPRIGVYLDIHREPGGFVHGLTAQDIRLSENGQPVTLAEFREIRSGLQVVWAVNPGRSFAMRNSQGVSRFDQISQTMVNWATGRRGSTIDDLSILLANGPEMTHFSDSSKVSEALGAYQNDIRSATPSLELLTRAVDVASDPSPRSGMERAIVFITSPLEGDLSFGVQSLISRANLQGVHIYVWLVASSETIYSQAVNLLHELAKQTGGEFITFSGTEAIPDPEEAFRNLRDIYYLAYQSGIKNSGTHDLAAEISLDGDVIQTTSISFDFNISPPDPAFLDPTLVIRRQPAARQALLDASAIETDLFDPQEHEVQVLIDFPDGRIRPIERTALLVDGVVVDENTAPPFERFIWDLRSYDQPAQHLIQVEVRDSFGLEGRTIETPIRIEVLRADVPLLAPLSQHLPAVAGLVLLFSAALVMLALIISGRIRPPGLRQTLRLAQLRPRRAVTEGAPEAVLPSAVALPGRRRISSWINRLHWPQKRLPGAAFGHFLPLGNGGNGGGSKSLPLPITAEEVTVGSDPNLATLVLGDPSVEALHARLVQESEFGFRLFDEGSVAGTWLNYAPVSSQGMPLQHGDVIHFGRVGLRYVATRPGSQRKVVVRKAEVGE